MNLWLWIGLKIPPPIKIIQKRVSGQGGFWEKLKGHLLVFPSVSKFRLVQSDINTPYLKKLYNSNQLWSVVAQKFSIQCRAATSGGIRGKSPSQGGKKGKIFVENS